MKNVLFILLLNLCACCASAQDSSNKAYFDAKTQLVNMLRGAEKLSYEKAIYTIENAWYNNQIRYADFDSAMNFHTQNIQRLYKANYNEAAIKERPSLLISKGQLLAQYKKALTNWAIYTYITQPTLYADSTTFFVHHKYNYSFADPMATNNWENTQVINLNNSKQGNCFALASLFKILADRLQSEAQLCTAPSHIYIAHEDEKGTMYNVELGSKNFPGTGMISAITYSTDQAIENNIAQRQLNTTQQVALALVYLAKGYQHKYNNYTDSFLLQCANAALQHDPKNLNALLLKAEWLENKLQTKNIAEIQATQDFQTYQNLLAQLYNLGYREMPLEMKNNIIKLYNKEKLTNVIANKERVIARRNDEAISATLSWGLFDERHTHKATERYGNTIFNTRSKKITAFASEQNLYNNYNFDPVVFAMNVDPLAHKFPSQSPYSAFGGNPIFYIDVGGAFQYPGDKGARYRTTYPMLTKYLASYIQRDVQKSTIIQKAMVENSYGGFDKNQLLNEVTAWGNKNSPTIIFKEGLTKSIGVTAHTPNSKEFWIDADFASAIEGILSDKNRSFDDKQAALTKFFETTIHETIHTGDLKNGSSSADEPGIDGMNQIFHNVKYKMEDGGVIETPYPNDSDPGNEELGNTKNMINRKISEGNQEVIPTVPNEAK